MARTLRILFSFPRPDLESKWWHRLAKVLVTLSTIAMVVLAIRWANESEKPYLVYSFQNDFSKYEGDYRVKNCSPKNLCGGDVDSVVFDYEISGIPGAYDYVHNREVGGSGTYSIFADLEAQGVFNNLKALDLQNNFYGEYYKLFFVLIPTLWYLFAIHVLYRVFAYILVGNK